MKMYQNLAEVSLELASIFIHDIFVQLWYSLFLHIGVSLATRISSEFHLTNPWQNQVCVKIAILKTET